MLVHCCIGEENSEDLSLWGGGLHRYDVLLNSHMFENNSEETMYSFMRKMINNDGQAWHRAARAAAPPSTASMSAKQTNTRGAPVSVPISPHRNQAQEQYNAKRRENVQFFTQVAPTRGTSNPRETAAGETHFQASWYRPNAP